jgi:hypothetical protein
MDQVIAWAFERAARHAAEEAKALWPEKFLETRASTQWNPTKQNQFAKSVPLNGATARVLPKNLSRKKSAVRTA